MSAGEENGRGRTAEAFKRADAASYDTAATEFDRLAERYSRPLAERLVELAGLRSRDRLLDVGTGTGVVARAAARQTPDLAELVAVDLSQGMLGRARSRDHEDGEGGSGEAATIRLCRMDAERLGFRDRRFDRVVSLFALLHLPDPLAALREIARVLKPGGRAVVGIGAGPRWTSREGVLEALRLLPELPLRLRGRLLVAPGHLEARIDEMLAEPALDDGGRRTEWSTDDPSRALPVLLKRAGLEPVERRWEGRRARIDDPEGFWRLQATFSTEARKRLEAAGPEARRRVRERVLEEARTVLDRGGRLVYPYGAALFVARRPTSGLGEAG